MRRLPAPLDAPSTDAAIAASRLSELPRATLVELFRGATLVRAAAGSFGDAPINR
jgi:hypothetical protein